MSTAVELLANREYKYGFTTDIETETIAKGLSEDTVRLISSKKNEPEWLLEFRLKLFALAENETAGQLGEFRLSEYRFSEHQLLSAPKQKAKKASLGEVDPELIKTFEKLGIPITEQKMLANVAVDRVFDSVSVATTFQEKTSRSGRDFLLVHRSGRRIPGID
jgi:Fe-S cluster assembly protein SufB